MLVSLLRSQFKDQLRVETSGVLILEKRVARPSNFMFKHFALVKKKTEFSAVCVLLYFQFSLPVFVSSQNNDP